MNKPDCVSILAGGGGTRLWPASTEQRPKQFIKIASDKSLLLQSLERSWVLEPTSGVFVVCNQRYIAAIRAEIALLPPEQARQTYVLPEPCMRNTATALYYVNQSIEQLVGPQAINLVQTSDHLIGQVDLFAQTIAQAVELAGQQRIVVFGLEPSYPACGYGYIERGAALPNAAFEVRRFTEKPDLATAEQFVASGRFYWNSGMFCYPAGLFRQELCAWTPEIPAAFAAKNFIGQLETSDIGRLPEISAAYEACPNISVDYALMEKTQKLLVLPARFDWNDIGSWDALAAWEPSSTPLLELGKSQGNFVRSSLPVALCDVSDLIVVEENGFLLICRKGSSQLVKEAHARSFTAN